MEGEIEGDLFFNSFKSSAVKSKFRHSRVALKVFKRCTVEFRFHEPFCVGLSEGGRGLYVDIKMC